MTAGILKILEHEFCFMSSGSYHVGVDVFFTPEIEIIIQVIIGLKLAIDPLPPGGILYTMIF